MAHPNIKLKLLVDKKAQRVLFAEATKDFVDFLFHIFSLPLGSLVELLGSKQMVGCLGKLKKSGELLSQDYLQPGVDKGDIFNPQTAFSGNMFPLLTDGKPVASKTLYRCSFDPDYGVSMNSCDLKYVTEHQNAECPYCGRPMDVRLKMVVKGKKNKKKQKLIKGYVKEVVTYMVMDNLEVKPMSTISSITLINGFGVKDFSQLEEKTLLFGKKEALKLVKASLITDQVLTTLYLQK